MFECHLEERPSDAHSSETRMRSDIVDVHFVLNGCADKEPDNPAPRVLMRACRQHQSAWIGEQFAAIGVIAPAIQTADIFDLHDFKEVFNGHPVNRKRQPPEMIMTLELIHRSDYELLVIEPVV